MQAELDDLIAKLSEFRKHSAVIDDIKAMQAKVSSELAATNAALDAAKGELASAHSGLSTTQVKNLRTHDEAIFNKAQKLKDLTARVAEEQTKLDAIITKVDAAYARHKHIEESLVSLRRHLG